jgi:hypothetical protein
MEKTRALLVRQFNYDLERIQDEEVDNLNISQAFDGIGKFGEILTTAIFPGSIGSASKGGCAFDNHCLRTNKKREVKTCCIIQPKICNTCAKPPPKEPTNAGDIVDSILAEIVDKIAGQTVGSGQTKVPFFQKRCLFCGETANFTYPKDSRFSIDCKAHFAYEADIMEYVFHLIDYKDDRIIFETFVIQSANRYFRQMLKNQLEKGSSAHCNFLPRSHDFYSSAPIKILEMVYTRDQQVASFVFNPENREICEYPVELLSKELKKTLKMDPQKTHISYEELEDKLEPKKKNFGKLRGAVTRGGTTVPPLPPHVRGVTPDPQ